ncbi:DUF4238 domain-containing protein [bacterium]|nr:DUF4238 domain-containing protein [bacterium]
MKNKNNHTIPNCLIKNFYLNEKGYTIYKNKKPLKINSVDKNNSANIKGFSAPYYFTEKKDDKIDISGEQRLSIIENQQIEIVRKIIKNKSVNLLDAELAVLFATIMSLGLRTRNGRKILIKPDNQIPDELKQEFFEIAKKVKDSSVYYANILCKLHTSFQKILMDKNKKLLPGEQQKFGLVKKKNAFLLTDEPVYVWHENAQNYYVACLAISKDFVVYYCNRSEHCKKFVRKIIKDSYNKYVAIQAKYTILAPREQLI